MSDPSEEFFDFLLNSSQDEREDIRLYAANEWARLCQDYPMHLVQWPLVLEILQNLSVDSSPRVRFAATRSLGFLSLPFKNLPSEMKKIRLSLEILSTEGNEEIRGRAIRSLEFFCRQMDTDCHDLRDGIRMIQRRIRDLCGSVRRDVAESLLHCLRHPALSSDTETAILESLGYLSLDPDPLVRGAALRAFKEAKELSKLRLLEGYKSLIR